MGGRPGWSGRQRQRPLGPGANRLGHRQAGLEAVFVETKAGPGAGIPDLVTPLHLRQAPLRLDGGAVEHRVRVVELCKHLGRVGIWNELIKGATTTLLVCAAIWAASAAKAAASPSSPRWNQTRPLAETRPSAWVGKYQSADVT